MKSILNIKKQHLTWLKLYLVITSALELKFNRKKKNIPHSVPKNIDFSQNSSVPFHQAPFCHSKFFSATKWKLQKLHKIWKKSLIHHKNKLLKKEKNITPAKANAPNLTNFFRTPESNNSYQMGNKELKIKVISKTSCQLELI